MTMLISTDVKVTPFPGLYPNVPAKEYHEWRGASASRLSKLARSPAHMKYAIENPEQTPAMSLGEAVHTAVLEPERFATTYAVAPECDRRTKEGKAIWEQFNAIHAGYHIIKAEDAAVCRAIRQAVSQHASAMLLLDGASSIELSALWKCRTTGVGCKLRADVVREDLGVVVDVKTTEDASRSGFEKSIFNFGYFRQAAHYLRGLAANGIGVDGFVFIAVEKSPPHAVAVYRLDDEVLAVGDEDVLRLLELYGKCEREGVYPAYPAEVQNIRIPMWALRQMNS